MGDQLGQTITKHVGHIEHASGITHHRFGSERTKGRDLANRLTTVLLFDILDDPLAIILTKIDIEVRHRDPLRVEEALKQQVIADGIQVSNT